MAVTGSRRYCTISVDVDSIDSVLRFHGVKKHSLQDRDPVYELAMPRILKLFDEYDVKATFFIVASDCHKPATQQVVKNILSRGHEIANHSLDHKFAFSLLSRREKERDIVESTRLIKDACGKAPVGFRVPGYDVDEETIDILDAMGYLYDSSLYKFYIYPVMRRTSYVSLGEVPARHLFKHLSAELRDVFLSPARPYSPMPGKFWHEGSGRKITEVPLSVIPFAGIPFNSTFLFLFGSGLFDLGLWCADRSGADLNYNFHSTDMLSAASDGISIDHPGLRISLEVKEAMYRGILEKIKKLYECVTLQTFCTGLTLKK